MQKEYTKIIFVFFLTLNSFFVKAQLVTIPDSNFVSWLNANGFASCMSGNMLDISCPAVLSTTSINCSDQFISNLTGIEYFVNLTGLSCQSNQLTSLPPLPPSLGYLYCGNNQLTTLPALPGSLEILSCWGNQLTALPALPVLLTDLVCGSNPLGSLPALSDSLLSLDCIANQLTYLPNLPTTLTFLSCSANSLTALPSLPPALQTLWCEMNQLTSLPALPSQLTQVLCWYNQLTSLPVLPASLVDLQCDHNQLTFLPSLPSSLHILNCNENLLTTLPNLPGSLRELECSANQLSLIPVLPNTLNHLGCAQNQLTVLPVLPDSLRSLGCDYNQLTVLPNLPDSLQYLGCYNNQLPSLPVLPPSLKTLSCGYNLLTSLLNLPSSITYLECRHILLDSLLNLPDSLNTLYCGSQQLTYLSALPLKLKLLDCAYSQLTSLPNLPDSLTTIYCRNNPLTYIPDLPDSVYVLDIRDDSSLICLPKFKTIYLFQWSNAGIICLPNAGYIYGAFPSIANLQLCQPASGCDFYWNMFGKLYNDTNANCLRDTNELLFKNIPVQLDSGGSTLQTFIGNTEGYYSFQTGLGNYQIKIDTTGLPFDVMCPVSGNYLSSVTSLDSLDADLDFGLQCKPGYLDLIAKSISPSSPLRPGALRQLNLNAGDAALFYGVSCATGVNGIVEAILNGTVSYISPSPGAATPSSVNGDTVIWNVTDFSLVNPLSNFNIIIRVDSNATLNDTLCFQLSISSVVTDNIPVNNSIAQCFPVVNSVDPNAKEIYPGGFVDTSAHEFTFTIYFQNTGNAVAENVYILDTLDDDLNLNTFHFLSSSHDAITQLLPGNILRFSFPGINLPDSVFNEPESHGYVQFKISRKDTIYPDMIILNHAQIFFDLNPPVTTNDAYAVFNLNCNNLLSISIPDTAICENEIFTASNNVNFPFPIDYEWLLDTTSVSTFSAVSVSGLSAGVHQLTLNASAGYCTVSQTQQIIVYPLPLQPVINISGDTLSTGTGFSYQWFLNSDSINGAVQNNYLISQSGWYSVLITDSNGCSALSDSVFVSPVGIAEIPGLTFNIFPNPVDDMLYIQIVSKAGESLNIELSDITGRKLHTIFNGITPSAFSKYSISLKSFSKGVFILKVNNLVKRVVVR